MEPELSIVLPCYNEAANLPLLAQRLAAFRPRERFELILVDNGSRDGSPAVLERLAREHPDFIRVVTVPENIGYGHGILAGLKAARAPVLAYSHADVQTPPEDVMRGLELIRERRLDMDRTLVKGLRTRRREAERFLTGGLTTAARWLLGYRMQDINGQPKLFGRAFFERWEDPPTDFSLDVYVMFAARTAGMALETFPVEFGTRLHGESKWAAHAMAKYKTILRYLVSIVRISCRHYSRPARLWRRLPQWGGT
ncbi:MAG: glycosyltransferase family 2 protein [Elusimicrobiota bacterium]